MSEQVDDLREEILDLRAENERLQKNADRWEKLKRLRWDDLQRLKTQVDRCDFTKRFDALAAKVE